MSLFKGLFVRGKATHNVIKEIEEEAINFQGALDLITDRKVHLLERLEEVQAPINEELQFLYELEGLIGLLRKAGKIPDSLPPEREPDDEEEEEVEVSEKPKRKVPVNKSQRPDRVQPPFTSNRALCNFLAWLLQQKPLTWLEISEAFEDAKVHGIIEGHHKLANARYHLSHKSFFIQPNGRNGRWEYVKEEEVPE